MSLNWGFPSRPLDAISAWFSSWKPGIVVTTVNVLKYMMEIHGRKKKKKKTYFHVAFLCWSSGPTIVIFLQTYTNGIFSGISSGDPLQLIFLGVVPTKSLKIMGKTPLVRLSTSFSWYIADVQKNQTHHPKPAAVCRFITPLSRWGADVVEVGGGGVGPGRLRKIERLYRTLMEVS